MTVALSDELPADAIEHLIVADIAPSSTALPTEFQGYVEAMKKIESSEVSSRREAQDILALYESVSRHLQHRATFLLLEYEHQRRILIGPDYTCIPPDQPQHCCAAFQVSNPSRYHRVFYLRPWWFPISTRRTLLAREHALREGGEEQVHQQEQHTHRQRVFP